eukprot:498598_1
MNTIVRHENIYIIGGTFAGLTNRIDVFDTLTDQVTISSINPLNYATTDASAIYLRDEIFVFGGVNTAQYFDTWQYYDFCDIDYETILIKDIPCECVDDISICKQLNKCYFDNIYDYQCKEIDDNYCNLDPFLFDIYKPCPCFNDKMEDCIQFDSCIWDQNVCKTNGYCSKETKSPTINPSISATIGPTPKCLSVLVTV